MIGDDSVQSLYLVKKWMNLKCHGCGKQLIKADITLSKSSNITIGSNEIIAFCSERCIMSNVLYVNNSGTDYVNKVYNE